MTTQPRNAHKRARRNERHARREAKRNDLRKQRASGRKTQPASSRFSRNHPLSIGGGPLRLLGGLAMIGNAVYPQQRQRQKVA